MNEQNIAARLDNTAARIESMALAIVGRVASWVAPIPVAVMTARAITKIFGLPWIVALFSSVALEIVGISASSMWMALKTYNRTKRKNDPIADEHLARRWTVIYFVTDFLIIIAITGVEFAKTLDPSVLIAILFPVMSVVGVLVLNLRVEHYDRLAVIEQDKAERRAKTGKDKQKKALPVAVSTIVSPDARKNALLDIWRADPKVTQGEAAEKLGVKRTTVGNYYRQLAKIGKVSKRNGSGYEVQG